MYCEYWKLTEPPFENVPNLRFVFYSDNHDEALMRLIYTVKGRKGACLLTGPVGSGKTTIGKVFQQKLRDEGCDVCIIDNPKFTGTELLEDILFHLGTEFAGTSRVQLSHAFRRKLEENYQAGKETIVIIDEAQLIKDDVYEELRLLLNYHKESSFLLTLILIGQPELKNTIHEIPQFEQRIPIRYHLHPLSFADTCRYIHYRLSNAGSKKDIFTVAAAKKIYQYSEGIPRLINNICDMSLFAGFIDKVSEVDRAIIDQVIEEQQ